MSDSSPSRRLASIDFLRGLAALAVALAHAYHNGRVGGPWWLEHLLWPITYGFAGVYLFFAISGFCIHMRWASDRARGVNRSIDFGSFWKRRLKRLYPAYFVFLVLCLLYPVGGQGVASGQLFWWDVGSHVLLIHNLDPRTVGSINGVFWTLAVEEQLYLLYFLLLWMRNRYGWAVTLGVTLMVRFAWMAIAFLLQRTFAVEVVVAGSAQATWCIWALGALAVEASLGLVTLPAWTRSIPLAIAVFAASCVLTHVALSSGGSWLLLNTAFQQLGFGVAAFFTVNALVAREATLRNSRNPVFKAGLWLGLISYSLYLSHLSIYALVGDGLLGLGVAIAAAAVCFRVLEKPFLNTSQAPRRIA